MAKGCVSGTNSGDMSKINRDILVPHHWLIFGNPLLLSCLNTRVCSMTKHFTLDTMLRLPFIDHWLLDGNSIGAMNVYMV
uniref:Uncharacterized protein n=1 Tax=Kalanchoe fedtschenkoi TaxID=63787 RepID=A0A7N0TSV0_KALFE